MGETISTAIIEPRFLVREALVRLMEHHTYRVAAAAASALDIDETAAAHAPNLAILGASSAASAATEASAIKRLWPDTKIILLFEQASPADFNQLLMSQIDACVPFFVSPDAFVRTLERIQQKGIRILLVTPSTWHSTGHPVEQRLNAEATASGMGPFDYVRTTVAEAGNTASPIGEKYASRTDKNGHSNGIAPLNSCQNLSEREQEILKGLVKGHSNKMIARTCAITEATVKVHMKSILRKIRVANRTQAAIWALENGHAAEEVGSVPTGTPGRATEDARAH